MKTKLIVGGGIAAGLVVGLVAFRKQIVGGVNAASQTVGQTVGSIPAGVVKGFNDAFGEIKFPSFGDDIPKSSVPTSADFNEDGALAGDEQLFKDNKEIEKLPPSTPREDIPTIPEDLDFSDLVEVSRKGTAVTIPLRTSDNPHARKLIDLSDIINPDGRYNPDATPTIKDDNDVIGLYDLPQTEFVESIPLSKNALDYYRKQGIEPIELI